jgi:xanthine dehydrogenase YagT iron-sulfur-binding subunit
MTAPGDDFPEENILPPTDVQAVDELLLFGSPATRRKFLKQIAGTSAAIAIGPRLGLFAQSATGAAAASAASKAGEATSIPVRLRINGKEYSLDVDTRTTLLDLLRERLNLTGSKKGCDHGQCGACTVLLNGRRVNSCLALAVMADGAEVTTIEGLANGEQLHPVQAAFVEHDGFQCGYCTPGQICSAVACIKEGHAKSDDEIREWMSGNLCRCGAYPNIVDAIKDAAAKSPA